MKRFIFIFSAFLIVSCTSKIDNYLNKGLVELQNHRVVNEDFKEGFSLKKIGIIKTEDKVGEYDIVFLLNDDVEKETVENYSMTIRVVPAQEEIDAKRADGKEIIWDFKPDLIIKNGHKYMMTHVKTDIKKAKELRFGLYHREGYQGKMLSKILTVRNMSFY